MSKPMTYWSISSQVLTEEAEILGLEVEVLARDKNLFIVRSAQKEVLFKSSDFGGNSSLAVKIVDDKELSYIFLERHRFPIAKSLYMQKTEFADFDSSRIGNLRFPLVIKPVGEAHGDGVQMHILDVDELQHKLQKAFETYSRMIVQEQIRGDECRVIVLFGEVILSYVRIPPSVVGDGTLTIRELIEKENKENPLRGGEYHSPLAHILVDGELRDTIRKQWYTLDDTLEKDKKLQVRGNSNMGTGGTARDITHIFHDQNKALCSNIAQSLDMNLCCIDLLSLDFSRPLHETGWVVLEIGGTPWLGGDRELTSVNTAREILQKLFF